MWVVFRCISHARWLTTPTSPQAPGDWLMVGVAEEFPLVSLLM
jgi:hypothetical protein